MPLKKVQKYRAQCAVLYYPRYRFTERGIQWHTVIGTSTLCTVCKAIPRMVHLYSVRYAMLYHARYTCTVHSILCNTMHDTAQECTVSLSLLLCWTCIERKYVEHMFETLLNFIQTRFDSTLGTTIQWDSFHACISIQIEHQCTSRLKLKILQNMVWSVLNTRFELLSHSMPLKLFKLTVEHSQQIFLHYMH